MFLTHYLDNSSIKLTDFISFNDKIILFENKRIERGYKIYKLFRNMNNERLI